MKYIAASATLAFLFTYSFGVSVYAQENPCPTGQEYLFGECYEVIEPEAEIIEDTSAAETTDATIVETESDETTGTFVTYEGDVAPLTQGSPYFVYTSDMVDLAVDSPHHVTQGRKSERLDMSDYSTEYSANRNIRFRGTARPALRTGALYTVGDMGATHGVRAPLDSDTRTNYKLAMREKFINDVQDVVMMEGNTMDMMEEDVMPTAKSSSYSGGMGMTMSMPKMLPSTGTAGAGLGSFFAAMALYMLRRREVF